MKEKMTLSLDVFSTRKELNNFLKRVADEVENFCYCGEPIDQSNPDCVEFKLCKEHSQDS